MKMRTSIIYRLAVMVAVVVFAIACSKEREVGSEWGYTEYYESSWLKDYEPVTMERTLKFGFNADAQQMFSEGGTIRFIVSKDRDNNTPHDDIVIYLNGVKQKGNTFTLNVEDDAIDADSYKDGENVDLEFTLGIEFLNTAAEGKHYLYLQATADDDNISFKNEYADLGDGHNHPIAASDLHFELGSLNSDGFYIIKEDIYNPADKTFWIVMLVIVGIFILYILIRPLIYPRISVRTIQIIGPKGFAPINLQSKSAYKIILTPNTTKKQGFMHRLFVGRVKYVKTQMINSDIIIKRAGRSSVLVLLPVNSPYAIIPAMIDRKVNHYKNPARLVEKSSNSEILKVIIQ